MDVLSPTSTSYFPGEPCVALDSYMEGTYQLSVRNYIKGNFDDEIQKFLHWIAPYVKMDRDWYNITFIGYMRHDETQHPTLIYFDKNGKVYLSNFNILASYEPD